MVYAYARRDWVYPAGSDGTGAASTNPVFELIVDALISLMGAPFDDSGWLGTARPIPYRFLNFPNRSICWKFNTDCGSDVYYEVVLFWNGDSASTILAQRIYQNYVPSNYNSLNGGLSSRGNDIGFNRVPGRSIVFRAWYEEGRNLVFTYTDLTIATPTTKQGTGGFLIPIKKPVWYSDSIPYGAVMSGVAAYNAFGPPEYYIPSSEPFTVFPFYSDAAHVDSIDNRKDVVGGMPLTAPNSYGLYGQMPDSYGFCSATGLALFDKLRFGPRDYDVCDINGSRATILRVA